VDHTYVTRAYADKMRTVLEGHVRLAQALAPAGEPILSTVFLPQWYLLTERLPSSGAYYYLPWQAAYNRAPVLDYRLDPCADLERAPPKLIVWDRWPVWDRYDVADRSFCCASPSATRIGRWWQRSGPAWSRCVALNDASIDAVSACVARQRDRASH